MSGFLNICVFISHVVTSGGKNGCSFDVTYLWAHDPNKFFRDFLCILCKMAKNCKNLLHIQKLSPFLVHYGDH